MNPIWRAARLAFVGLIFSLAGCSGLVLPGVPPTPSPTPLAIIDSHVRPERSQVPPPESRESALAAATETVNAAESVLVGILRGEYAFDSLSEFEAETYLETTNAFIDGLAESSTFAGVSGEASRWYPNAALSSAATLTVDGVDFPYGEVTMVGCFESLWEVVDPGQEQSGESTVGQFLPARMVVKYEPSRSVWLVTEGTSLVDQADAPDCQDAAA